MKLLSRRDTIKSLTLVIGASLFSPLTLIGNSFPKNDKLGVALVGLDYYSIDLLAPALQQT
jgi:glucose-fructose oxidoreductase